MRPQVATAVLLLLTACAPASEPGAGPIESTTGDAVPSASTVDVPSGTTLLVPLTVDDSTTTTMDAGIDADVTIVLPGLVEKVDVGEVGVVALGVDEQSNRQMLWVSTDLETWSEVSSEDLFGDAVLFVTDVVIHDGRFMASVMGDPGPNMASPVVLISDDGVSWSLQTLVAAPHFQTVAFTPESPPYPGAAGMTDLEVYGGRLYAAGWVADGMASSSAVWESSGGEIWDITVLPNMTFPNEWATDLSVGPLGMLVAVGGPVYSGAGVQYSPDGDVWTQVEAVDEWAAVAVSQNDGLLSILRLDLNDSLEFDVLTSDDGRVWRSGPPMPAELEGATLGSGLTWDPVVFDRYGSAGAFVLDRGAWSELRIGAWDQVIDITEGYVIGASAGNLLLADRHP